MVNIVEGLKVKISFLLLFLGLEFSSLAAFLFFTESGQSELAWVSFLAPFQILLWSIFANKDARLLSFLVFMIPLSVLNLLPAIYRHYVLLPITLGLLLFLRWNWFSFEQEVNKRHFSPVDRFFPIALIIWIVLSLVLTLDRGWGSSYLIKTNFYTLQIFIIGYFCATVPENLSDVRGLLMASIFGSIAAILLMLLIMQLEGAANWLSFKRVPISFGLIDFNAVGAIVAGNAVALLGLYVTRQARRITALGIVFLLVILVLTRSRGAWLGFGIAFLYLLFRTRSFELTILGGVAGAIIMLTDILKNIFTTRLTETSVGDPALAGRAVLWLFAWRVAKANWLFGVGWENFRLIKPIYGFPSQLVRNWTDYNAHNIFLEIMADLGLVGLLLFLGLFFLTLIQLDRSARRKDSPAQGLALALNAAIICFLVHGLWDCLSYTFLVLGIWVGLAMALKSLLPFPKVPSFQFHVLRTKN